MPNGFVFTQNMADTEMAWPLVKLRNMTAITVLALILAVGMNHQLCHFFLTFFQFLLGSFMAHGFIH
jgi:hypothetical protein